MQVLVDTSVWIDYFKEGRVSEKLDFLIEENIVVINDLILAELVPFLKISKKHKIITLLNSIYKLDLVINWKKIIDYQYRSLIKGINGIGLPDLIIINNAVQNNCWIYSLDKHFILLRNVIDFKLID